MLKKVMKKFELPLTIITLITFAILLIMAFYSANSILIGILSLCFIFTLVDFISQMKDKKNVKG